MATERATIQNGWKKINLEKECWFERGMETGADAYNTEGIGDRFIRVVDVTESRDNPIFVDGIHTTKRVKKSDILLTLDGTVGAVRMGLEGIYSTGVRKVSFRNEEHSNRLLYYLLQSEDIQRTIDLYASGSTIKHASSAIPHLVAALPEQLVEQNKIADILELVDQAIEKTDTLTKKYERISAGMMQDLFRYGIDENGRVRSENGHEFSNSQLGRIPKSWQVVEYHKTCTAILVGIVIKPTQYYVENGVPALRSQNVTEVGINYSDFVYISEKANRLLCKSVVRSGDIVTVRTGAPGTSTVIPVDLDGVNCIDIIISKPKKNTNPVFLSKYLNSFQGKLQILMVQGGVAQQHFNVGELKKILVPLPSFQEQNKIADKFMTVDAQIELEEMRKRKLVKIKSGLMSSLLTGAVRIGK